MFDDYTGDDQDSGMSGILSGLIQAGTSLGTTAILASQAPQAIAPYSYVPGQTSQSGIYQGAVTNRSMTSLIWFGLFALVAFFLIREF
jgi:hypothetical protein